MQTNAISLPISFNFHVMLLLVNVKFPSEFCQEFSEPLLVSLMAYNKKSYFTMAYLAFHA